MGMVGLIGFALLLAPGDASLAAASSIPPEPIILPVIQPDCDRTGEEEVVVCGRSDRRFRIDRGTLETIRAIEERDDPAKRPRPRAITEGCSGIGPMDACGGDIPISSMAVRAIGLIVKAVRGEDLRPAFRQGPTDYELYQRRTAKVRVQVGTGRKLPVP